MTAAFTILPLITLLFFALIVWFIIKTFAKNTKYLSRKKGFTIILTYLCVLLVSVVLQFTLLKFEDSGELRYDREKLNQIETDFFNATTRASFEKIEEVRVTDEWSFPIVGNELTLTTASDDYYHGSVIVEKKPLDDGIVEVFRYATPDIASGVDFSEYVPSQDVKMVSDNLIITRPPYVQVKLSKFHKEFTVTQWTGEKMFDEDRLILSANQLYLLVPQNVEVKAVDQVYVRYMFE